MIVALITAAPKDGTLVRIVVARQDRHLPGELPWLAKWEDGCWRYATTGAPLHPWHEPIAWIPAPRLVKERAFFDAKIRESRGDWRLPSGALAPGFFAGHSVPQRLA